MSCFTASKVSEFYPVSSGIRMSGSTNGNEQFYLYTARSVDAQQRPSGRERRGLGFNGSLAY